MKRNYQEALLGFAICAAWTVAIFAAMYFGAPIQAQYHVAEIVETFGVSKEQALAFLDETARYIATNFIKLLLPMFAIYWFVAGLLGRTPILKSKIANALLIAGSLGMTAEAANFYYFGVNTYCDVLPYPHEGFQIFRINECPSSQTFFTSLFWISVTFFPISLIVRLVRSRKNAPVKC